MRSSWCPVRQSYVTHVTIFEGAVATVFCSEYQRGTRTCRMKREALDSGPLSQLVMDGTEHSLADRLTHCTMW
jgi:hypothetical protein